MTDPYSFRNAFDDLAGNPEFRHHFNSYEVLGVNPAAARRAVRAVILRARGRRLAVPLTVEPASRDTTGNTFHLGGRTYEILGDAESHPGFSALEQRFATASPPDKLVRLDTPASYSDFREERRQPYVADLEARLAALESAFSRHVDDEGGRLGRLEQEFGRHVADRHSDRLNDLEKEFRQHATDPHAHDIIGLARAASAFTVGGEEIPVVKNLQGKVECWQDGDEVVCTIRFLNKDGQLRLATTATPVDRHIEEVIDCAGDDFEHVVPSLGRMAQILGSTEVIRQLCQAVPIFSTARENRAIIGVMRAPGNPSLAAAMALLQFCQQGSRRACDEVRALEDDGAGNLLAQARDLLAEAQAKKARGRLR